MRKSLIHLLILIFCFWFNLKIEAQQNFEIESISTEEGLSQGMINDILQDREGFLWIATKDGLNRYDGHNFKIFTNDPNDPWSISGNTIIKLFEDSDGRIWATSDNSGINIYDKKTGRFHHIRHQPNDPSSLTGNYIDQIIEDTSGYFITRVENQEINMFRLNADFFTHKKSPQIIRIPMPIEQKDRDSSPYGYRMIRGLIKDKKERIWVGGNKSIYKLDVQQAKLVLSFEGTSFEFGVANPDGSIFGCNFDPLFFVWDGNKITPIVTDFDASDVALANNSTMWILNNNRLYGIDISDWKEKLPNRIDDKKYIFDWSPSTEISSIQWPHRKIQIDQAGIIWVGTNGYGLYKINPKKNLFNHALKGVSIRNIVEKKDGQLILQNYSSEWVNEDLSCIAHAEFPPARWGCFAGQIIESKSNSTWYLYMSYLDENSRLKYNLYADTIPQRFFTINNYDPITKDYNKYKISWSHADNQPILESKDGTIWMAGYNDVLSEFDPISKKFTSYNTQNGKQLNVAFKEPKSAKSENYSTALFEDSNGTLWVGTGRGFSKCTLPQENGQHLKTTHYANIPGDQNSLNYNHVSCFIEDPAYPSRFLWVGTKGGGLNRFDKIDGSFKHLTTKDGLPNDVVYGLLSDEEGNIWGSTNKGLFCMSQQSEDETQVNYSFRNFSKADGLQDNEFNTGAYRKLSDGRLVFGGVNGYNTFDPKEVLSSEFTPDTYITDIFVNNKPVSVNDETKILKNTIETSQSITLSHLDKILTLEFASLDFTDPERIKYRYQLVGADNTWVDAGNNRSATFLNLQPKNYTFRVQGTNSQGIWNDQIAELQINILPPWWNTWWAYFLYIIIALAAISIYIRFYINRAKLRQQLQFEKRETDRVKELDTLKTQLYINMTHEFRTPLTIILGMAKQVKEDPKKHFSSGMNMIIGNGQNLLGLVNKMLNLSKLESGKMKLDLRQSDIVLFLRHLVESFRSYASKKEIQLHFLPEIEYVLMDFDQDKLQQIISNLISNAFKFTPHGGHIYFSIRKENDQLQIRVKDTGRGVNEEDKQKIFERFYQTDNSSTREYEGTGIGLALSKQLTNLMGGQISVESPPLGSKKGTEFQVNLPITQNSIIIELEEVTNLVKFKNSSSYPSEFNQPNESKPLGQTPAVLNAKEDLAYNSKKLILLVEDNEDIVAYVASILKDHQLIVGVNGQEGYELATERVPDIIISDVMMPVMDGFELVQKLKLDNRTDHIPIILLTARADMESKLEGLEYGATTYLAKPFEKQELLYIIKNLFELRNKLQLHYQSTSGLLELKAAEGDLKESSTVEDAFIIKTRDIIEANLKDFDFSVEDLAKELHLSHSQLGRKLNALSGFSPNTFIRNSRLKKAKEILIADREVSISTVAFDSGFNDPSYFSRIFKREIGQSPNEWRKSN